MKWPWAGFVLLSWATPGLPFAATPQGAAERVDPVASKRFEVHGVLRQIDAARRQVVVSHDTIPGYMGAMTMPFEVADVSELRGLKVGDVLHFQLSVTTTRAWIDQIVKAGTTETPLSLSAPEAGITQELKEGDVFPEFEYVDTAGKKRRFGELRGRAVALTFVYTRCPLPTFCPLLNRNFQSAQQLLERMKPGNDIHFLSLSMDPQHDTADLLDHYAKGYDANPARWTFALADEATLRVVGDSAGLEIRRTGETLDHNLRTIVIDGTGRVRHIFRGNSWTPQELAAELFRK